MIKRLLWFTSGLAAGAGAVVLLGKRIRRRVSALAPVRLAERGVERVRHLTVTVQEAWRDGAATMRRREQELHERINGDRRSQGDGSAVDQSSKIIVLHDHQSARSEARSSISDSSPRRR